MKFERGADPMGKMGLGYGNKQKTKAWKVLEFIGSKGEEGAGLTEIQRFIWEELQGYESEDFEETSTTRWGYAGDSYANEPYNRSRASRGYWTNQLYGNRNYPGLLYKYCKKSPTTKKWVLDRMPRPGEDIYENQSGKLVSETLNEMLNKKNGYIK